MFELSKLHSDFLIFIFPGFLFLICSIFFWMQFSNYFLRRINNEQNLSIKTNIKELILLIKEKTPPKHLSSQFSLLILRVIIILFINIILISSLFSESSNNFLLILFLYLISFICSMIYNNNNNFTNKHIHELIIFSSLFLWIFTLEKFTLTQIIINPWSNNVLLFFFQLTLFLIIISSIGKINTYFDYDKGAPFIYNPNELNDAMYNLIQENHKEKLIRWFVDSYNQSLLSLILVLITITNLLPIFGILSDWIYILILVMFWFLFLLISLLINLLSRPNNSKVIGREINLKLLLLFIMAYYNFFI